MKIKVEGYLEMNGLMFLPDVVYTKDLPEAMTDVSLVENYPVRGSFGGSVRVARALIRNGELVPFTGELKLEDATGNRFSYAVLVQGVVVTYSGDVQLFTSPVTKAAYTHPADPPKESVRVPDKTGDTAPTESPFSAFIEKTRGCGLTGRLPILYDENGQPKQRAFPVETEELCVALGVTPDKAIALLNDYAQEHKLGYIYSLTEEGIA